MYDFIEWNPEQVTECAKKCDAAGEIFSNSKLASISTGTQHQEALDELIQEINGLIAGLTLRWSLPSNNSGQSSLPGSRRTEPPCVRNR